MISKKHQTIRIHEEIHHLAKMAATEKKMTLQNFVEKLLLKECKSQNLEEMNGYLNREIDNGS